MVKRAAPPPGWPPTNQYGTRAVLLANDHHGTVGRAVRALAGLPSDLPRHALVGGLAVMVRLYEAHRVTTDFDEVSQGREVTISRLLSLGAARTSSGVELPDHGIQLDLLEADTDLITLAGLAGKLTTKDEQRGWQLAMVCRYALDTAALTDIVVARRDEIVSRVTIPVALAGTLVAMKVHSALAPDRSPGKKASDIYDAFRLIRSWSPGVVAEDLSRAPVSMLTQVQREVCTLFSDDVDRSVRWLASTSVPGVEQVDADLLGSVSILADLLAPFLHWDEPGHP